MTDRISPDPDSKARSGRRYAVDIEAPRDQTVCFTVSADEKEAIDSLASSVNRTRSAVLVRIANAFVQDAAVGRGTEHLQALLDEVRGGELSRETLEKRR